MVPNFLGARKLCKSKKHTKPSELSTQENYLKKIPCHDPVNPLYKDFKFLNSKISFTPSKLPACIAN